MFGVQPIPRKWFAGGAFTLRDFVFVMRKREVDSAGVDIERFSKIFHGHGGTFDVPAGAARADLRFPEVLARLWRLPESKVAGAFFFVAVVVNARTGLNTGQINF